MKLKIRDFRAIGTCCFALHHTIMENIYEVFKNDVKYTIVNSILKF